MRTGAKWLRAAAGPACVLLLACEGGPGPDPIPADAKRVLFIGNSLTYTHDLPGVVQALAAAAGEPLYVESVAAPDVSLEDHWNGGEARQRLARGRWDVVVLQQGPSALPESRVLLLEYARRFAAEARAAGATPALYSVWPSTGRAGDFDRVSESYRLAAAEVDGSLFPAGETWRAAWARDAALPLYGPDGFHPSPLGTYAAALAVVGRLTGRSPVGLPARVRLRSGGELSVPPAAAALLQQAATEVLAREAAASPSARQAIEDGAGTSFRPLGATHVSPVSALLMISRERTNVALAVREGGLCVFIARGFNRWDECRGRAYRFRSAAPALGSSGFRIGDHDPITPPAR